MFTFYALFCIFVVFYINIHIGETPGLDEFIGKCYKIPRKGLSNLSRTLPKLKTEREFPSLFSDTCVTLIPKPKTDH